MRRYIRMFKFYFLWQISMKVAERMLKKEPMYFPHFLTLSFSRDRVKEYYLANYTISESVIELFAEKQRVIERNGYKQRKRGEMLMAMTEEEHEVYYDRVARWEEYHEFDDARSQFTRTETIAAPEHGGCWFCNIKNDELVFDTEFDTNVHKECIMAALKHDPNHREAIYMKYLLT